MNFYSGLMFFEKNLKKTQKKLKKVLKFIKLVTGLRPERVILLSAQKKSSIVD